MAHSKTPATRDSEVKLLEVEDYERSSISHSNMGSQMNYANNYSLRFSSSGDMSGALENSIAKNGD